MLRNHLLSAMILLAGSSSYSRATEKIIIRDIVPDTVYKTRIERLLRETGVLKKAEYAEVIDVQSLYFRIVTISNLRTGVKEKGVYVSTLNCIDPLSDYNNNERHAYLDVDKVDNLISFLDSSDAHWKTETAPLRTLYEYETADNLRVSFSATSNSHAWLYYIRFAGYRFNSIITLKKSQSDELLAALKQIKSDLQK